MAKAIGSVKGPDGSTMNPLERFADKEDLEKIASGVNDVTWGSAQVFKGVVDGTHHKNSIIGMANANVFEFPVFISESVPLEYATATNTLLEQMYAAYLQMAISINPVVDYKQVRERQNHSQFSKFKTNTTKYVEYVDLSYQKDACHNKIVNEDGSTFEFDMVSIDDSDARMILESLDYQPLSEFDHYFMEGYTPRQARDNARAAALRDFIPTVQGGQIQVPVLNSQGNVTFDANNRVRTRAITINSANMGDITNALRALSDSRANYEVRGTLSITTPGGQPRVMRQSELENEQRALNWLKSMWDYDESMERLSVGRNGVQSILAKPARDWTATEVERVSNYFDGLTRKQTHSREKLSNIIQRAQNGQNISASEAELLKSYFQADKTSSEAQLAAEKSGASITTMTNIMAKPSDTWNSGEIEKVTNYFKAEEEVRKQIANSEDARDIIDKIHNGENITGEEQNRLKNWYDMLTSRGKAAEMAESRQRRSARVREDYRQLSNGLVTAGSVIRQLSEKGINIEKSRADLEKLTKDLQDVDDAELVVTQWLNSDDSPEDGGMTAAQKRRIYGPSLAHMRARDIRNDHRIKANTARELENRIRAYDQFREKYGVSPDEFELETRRSKEAREERKERYDTRKTVAPQFIDENKIKKMNTLKPLMMTVTMNIMADDGHISHPMEYIVGVKTHCRIIKSSTLPEVVQYPIKEMNQVTRKTKWRAGELRLFHDILFHIKEKKQTAIDSRDPNRKWYRRLYELAHMKGDGNVSKAIAGGGSTDGLIPNATIMISKSDADHIEEVTKIDIMKASNARKLCEELFLISFVIIDIDNESIRILCPDINNEFEVQSLAAVNKQIAELDTAGRSTRDIFKMLK